MSCESPITVFQEQMQMQIAKDVEGEILRAVHKVGVTVDKVELLKALKYDRDQYEKGYKDGLNVNKWIPVSERLPETDGQYLCQVGYIRTVCFEVLRFSNDLYSVDEYDFEKCKGKNACGFYEYDSEWGHFAVDVVAWMPLPEPYKEEGAE